MDSKTLPNQEKHPPAIRQRLRPEVLASRILIVEDDPLSILMLRKIFEKEGFQNIQEAHNGREGLIKTKQFRPQLIVADIQMPEMDGFALCEQIRQDPAPEISQVPILIQTALTHIQDKTRIFAAGATDYVTKPVDPEEIIARGVVHIERSLLLHRLQKFSARIHSDRAPENLIEKKEEEFWSFKKLSGTVNSLLDEIEQSHDDLKAAKEKAERADRLKTEFLASVTHELKTPLHCIINFAQIGSAQFSKGKFDEANTFFGDIVSNGRRLDNLISDLLDLSKIETGNIELKLRPQFIMPLLEKAVASTRKLAEEKDLRIEINGIEEKKQFYVDSRRIEQVFVNLLSNAIRFSPPGSTISWKLSPVEARLPGTDIKTPSLSITIEDEGTGIPEGEQERIFEPFVQLGDESTRKGGTGLGLAITRKLIGLFHGTITAGNTPKGGAAFNIILPFPPHTH